MTHRLSPTAKEDLAGIWRYVAGKSGSANIADTLIASIAKRFIMLSRHPYAGRNRDEDLRPGLRTFPVDSYIIVYRIEGDDVVILHVVRGDRDLEALLGEP